MNKKWHLWRWLALASILFGIALAVFQPALKGSGDLNDFEWHAILFRFFNLAPLCFFALALLVFLLKFGRIIFRRLFTRRFLKGCLRALAGLMILVALFYVEENWRGQRAWEHYQHAQAAKGEKFDFASFIPPPVPDDQNFALTPIVASGYRRVMDENGRRISPENTNVVNRLTMTIYRPDYNGSTNLQLGSWQKRMLTDLAAWQDYYRVTAVTNVVDRFGWQGGGNVFVSLTNDAGRITQLEIQILASNQFAIAAQPQSPAADVLLALSKFDPAIEELRQASRLPFARFPLDYTADNPIQLFFPHRGALNSCALVLRLRAIAELDNGQAAKALADVRLMLYLAGSIRREPSDYSFEEQMSLVNFAVQPIWEGLARRQWSADQLAALEQDLAGIEAVKDYGFALRAGLASNLKSIEYLRRERMTNSITCMCGDTLWIPTLIYRLSPSGWFYLNERATARVFEAALPTASEAKQRILSPEISERFGRAESLERQRRFIPGNIWLALVPPLDRKASFTAHIQAGVDMARAACALERCRLAQGRYPEKLDALAPQFIEKIPHDLINGQPLHYRRTDAEKFILYSVGWDGVDDGGRPEAGKSFLELKPAGDWVWQYPLK